MAHVLSDADARILWADTRRRRAVECSVCLNDGFLIDDFLEFRERLIHVPPCGDRRHAVCEDCLLAIDCSKCPTCKVQWGPSSAVLTCSRCGAEHADQGRRAQRCPTCKTTRCILCESVPCRCPLVEVFSRYEWNTLKDRPMYVWEPSASAAVARVPKCPKCGIEVHKDGGCNEISHCGVHFCYECGFTTVPTETSVPQRHWAPFGSCLHVPPDAAPAAAPRPDVSWAELHSQSAAPSPRLDPSLSPFQILSPFQTQTQNQSPRGLPRRIRPDD